MTTPGPSVSGQPTPTPKIVASEYDAEAEHHDWLVRCLNDAMDALNGTGRYFPALAPADVPARVRYVLDENARLRSQLAKAREALCQPGAIRCEAGKQAILSVSGTGHDSIAKVAAERDELLAALNRFRDVVDFSEATTHMDVAEIVVAHIRNQAADLSLFRSESDLELTQAIRERDSLREERDRLVAEVCALADDMHDEWQALLNPDLGVGPVLRDNAARLRAVAAAAPAEAPAEPPWPVLKPNMIVMVGSNPYHSFRVGGWEYGEEDVTVTLIPGGPVPPGAYGPDGNPLPAGPSPAASAEPADIPPPVGEGAALIAATEQEIDAAIRAGGTTVGTLAEQAQRAWMETARILARALDGRPVAPVQPEGRRPQYERDAAKLAQPGWCREQIAELTVEASERGLRWKNYAVVPSVIAEIDRLRVALATAEREREAAIAERNARSSVLKDVIAQREQAYQARDRAGAEHDALRAEVQRADKLLSNLRADVLTDTVGISAISGRINLIRDELRAALGSTPDTGSTK